ncbi:hypothetical protein ACLOJK_026504 [Asimina triloba]
MPSQKLLQSDHNSAMFDDQMREIKKRNGSCMSTISSSPSHRLQQTYIEHVSWLSKEFSFPRSALSA